MSRTRRVVFCSRAEPKAWIDLGPNLLPSSSSFLKTLLLTNIFASSTPSASSICLRARWSAVNVELNATFDARILQRAGPRLRPESVFLRCIVALQIFKHNEHAALESVHLLLFLLSFLSQLKRIVLISLFLLLLLAFLLLAFLLTKLLLLLNLK